MSSKYSFDKYDLSRIVAKPLYFGLVVNVVAPVGLLMVCYFLQNRHFAANRIGGGANMLFYVFAVLALAEAGLALWWRGKVVAQPLVRRIETLEEDLRNGLARVTRPVFLLIASISIYGYVYFFLTGRFEETVLFVVFSFLVFQIVRPRYGMVQKIVEHQLKLADEGKFYTGQ